MKPTEFKTKLADHGILLTKQQQEQFLLYYQKLITANQQVNLTAITSQAEVYLKHFYDSLTLAFVLPQLQQQPWSVCDVGAGAGFPSLPLKIVFPQLRITIVDSLNKRVNFLAELVDELGLQQVELHHARAEEFGSKQSSYRESYDLVTARAVARLDVLSELCLPLVKIGGRFVAMKSQKAQAELAAAQFAIKTLGGKLEGDQVVELPENGGLRHLILLAKTQASPAKYPRKSGLPNKKPLQQRKD